MRYGALLSLLLVWGGSVLSHDEERIVPVVHLPGSMDGEDGGHPAMYFGHGSLNFQLDASGPDPLGPFDRLTIFVPRVGGAKDERPYPQVLAQPGEAFDPEQVHISEDGRILILKASSAGGARWLFIDTETVEPIGALPESQVIIENDQLSWEGAGEALDRRLRALLSLDPWERALWPQHEVAIRDGRAIVEDWLQNAVGEDFDAEGVRLVRELMAAPVQAIEPSRLLGAWRVRSIQADPRGVYVYPFFAARIERAGEALRLRKTSGSQRRQGLLFTSRGGPEGLIFLGGATVNEEPPVGYSGLDPEPRAPRESDTVGVLWQLSPDHLIVLLDASYGGGFEIYELRR